MGGKNVRRLLKETINFYVFDLKYKLRFSRRRYGHTTYTWVELWHNEDWVLLGDPWPCVTPSNRELRAAIDGVLSRKSGEAGIDSNQI